MWMLEEMKLKKAVLPEHVSSRVFQNLNTPEDLKHFREEA